MGGSVIGQAKNGIEAVDLYLRLNPDLVMLDITMPELDGIETLHNIIDKNNNAKVIIMSSLGHKKMICKALDLGAMHYITKPYESRYAEMIIKSVVERKEGGSE
jgi:two-component system chemotaxis response regulator CheY